MKRRVVTNESFEKYIDHINRKRGRRFEDRWDSLDLDDVTANINVPSEGEINSAIRELDLLDDAAIETGAQDVEVGSDGKLRLLDFDDSPSGKNSGSRSDDDKVIELDFDDKGADSKDKKSNVGLLGALDYDDDVDTSYIAASIDDVYAALSSSDPNIVKAMIKRYAADINDEDKIKEVMLTHAVQLNYDSLRVMCGDMKIVLSAKEKSLGFIDRGDIRDALAKFKEIASKLTGENNTYGLIPNAIVSCGKDDQITCVNIIDFLIRWCNLPLIPIYFRGAMTRKLYDLADYILDELPADSLDTGLLTGTKGLLTRIKGFNDIPKPLLKKLMNQILNKDVANKYPSRVIGDMLIICVDNDLTAQACKLIDFESNKGMMVLDYVEDESAAAWEVLKNKLKLDV